MDNLIKSKLNTLIKVYSYSSVTKDDFKEILMKELEIKGNEKTVIWDEDDYDNSFAVNWINHSYSRILKISSVELFTNMLPLNILIKRTLAYEGEMNDFVKFTLYYIVDNMSPLKVERIGFFSQKLKVQNKGNEKFLVRLMLSFNYFYRIYVQSTQVYLNEFSENLLNENISEGLLDLQPDLTFIKKNMDDEGQNDYGKIKESLGKVSKYVKGFNDLLNSTVNEDNIDKWNCLKRHEFRLTTYISYFEKYYEEVNFFIDNYNEKNHLILNFPEIVYFNYVPICYEKKINPYKQKLESFLNSPDFKRLFEKVLASKPITSFYKRERAEYFSAEPESSYYILPHKFDYFWKSIKLIPLPENIAGATTKMLTMYINTIPKAFDNIENITQEEEEIVNKSFILVN
jgi:hypothetical protein